MASLWGFCLVHFFLCTLPVTALWPQPRNLTHGASTVWISPSVQLRFVDERSALSHVWRPLRDGIQYFLGGLLPSQGEKKHNAERDDVVAAFERAREFIFNHRFVPRKFYPRNFTFEPGIDESENAPHVKTLIVTLTPLKCAIAENRGRASSDEAYQLWISESGNASITASGSRGAIYGIDTFAQLFYAHSLSVTEGYLSIAPVHIVDSPAFDHRGVNLDISRNWIAPTDAIRVLEAMAHCKFNKLHLHASDAQSWPLDIPSLPGLAAKGAYDSSQIWSPEDLRWVQRHGRLRGIEVYLEIDIPGHTTSVAASQPELIASAYREPWITYAAEPPAGQLTLGSADVMAFLKTLLNDLVPRNAEVSSHFHLGGDEVNAHVYGLGSDSSVTKDKIRAQVQKIMDQAFAIASKYKQTTIVWEELLLEWNLTLPSNTIIQTWRSNEALAQVLARGHRVLFGASTHWYLDCGHGAWFDPATPERPGPDPRASPPYMDQCAPYKNWRTIYSYNPLEGLSPKQRHLIAGGEVHMWTEMTDAVTLDGMLWPRAAVAAEILWTGTGTPVSEDTTRRLAELRERLVLEGVKAGVVQMEWCLRNKGGCTV
ncbi:glycoside hydrolase family 20 protein [Lepidopterella palustris CBS 459.81]|uniref:Beta-hexosaminidase n=1 Tax=Lepidopterella palustris CBS 459.81 TaxID=1314670 RepID=A0A8E2DWX4_9PEZI|nr:glycoside hydrolase family 20 protein [Lepidopterella palustris CBS 459.81]